MNNDMDFREVIDGEEVDTHTEDTHTEDAPKTEVVAKDGTSEKKEDTVDKTSDYEEVCMVCRRPESVAGPMIRIQQNMCVCKDCMQRTFDSVNSSNFGGSFGFPMGDMSGMPPITMMNLSDLMGGIPQSQKVKKKEKKAEKKEAPVLDIHSIPAPHKIKASLDEVGS